MSKKVTIQFYANTRLKPKQIVWNGKLTDAYPLYVTVIYQGSNTQFKADLNEDTILVTEDLAQIQGPDLQRKLDKYQDELKEIVIREEEQRGNKFSLSGLGKRYTVYQRLIDDMVAEAPMGEVMRYLEKQGYKLAAIKQKSPSDKWILLLMGENKLRISAFEWVFGSGKDRLLSFAHDKGIEVRDIDLGLVSYLIENRLFG